MRNLTKASREASRSAQFESLVNNGYIRETYKGLEIFYHSENLLLKIFEGTAANHSLFYKYRSLEDLQKRIQMSKESHDRREQWKAEQKEKKSIQGAKITLATVKKFIRENKENLYLKQLSRFDGMTDCVERVNDDFSQVNVKEEAENYSLGVFGLWLVGGSRDSFSNYKDNNFEGIVIYNSCGSCIIAKKIQTEQPKETRKPAGKIQIVDYSEKAIAVTGDFSEYYDDLINLGGRYNRHLTCGKGIIFSKKRLDAVKAYFLAQKEQSNTNTPDEQEKPENKQINEQKTQVEQIEPMPILESNNYFDLETFKIIWHEGKHIEGATFENETFKSWEDVQRAFYILWHVNEKGQGGGYTKVKCEIKLQGKEPETVRIDITDKVNNGDFNPSAQHITEYLVGIFEDENETAQQITELFS